MKGSGRVLIQGTVTCRDVTIDGVWIGEWIYRPLTHTTRIYKQLNVIGNLHNSQITTAHAKPFRSLLCLHQPFPGNGF
jgi:hypothetical protein